MASVAVSNYYLRATAYHLVPWIRRECTRRKQRTLNVAPYKECAICFAQSRSTTTSRTWYVGHDRSNDVGSRKKRAYGATLS